MNYLEDYSHFDTLEDGLSKLKEAVALRDQMGGAMYWNIMNEDCVEIANKIRSKWGRQEAIREILGEGTFQ